MAVRLLEESEGEARRWSQASARYYKDLPSPGGELVVAVRCRLGPLAALGTLSP